MSRFKQTVSLRAHLFGVLFFGATAHVWSETEGVAHALTSSVLDSAALDNTVLGNPALDNTALDDTAALVTFTGLRVYEDGSSTIIVNLTKSTSVIVSQDGKEVSFLLSGAKVKWRNNKNALLAEHFNSNVLATKLDDSKEGARLVVILRQRVLPEHQMTATRNGAYLRIFVPPPAKS